MFEVGKLYKTNAKINFGCGNKKTERVKDIYLPADSCLLYLFSELVPDDMDATYIHFLYDNEIIFRSMSEYDDLWFVELKE